MGHIFRLDERLLTTLNSLSKGLNIHNIVTEHIFCTIILFRKTTHSLASSRPIDDLLVGVMEKKCLCRKAGGTIVAACPQL